jgi:heme/copper-type cytochrome/quinol oxidase subunit 3
MAIDITEKLEMERRTAKPLLWVGIVSIIMLFAGFTSAYIVRQAEGNWLVFPFPNSFYVSTAIIFLSSITMWLASRNIKRNEKTQATKFLGYTLILGLAFVISQFISWNLLLADGVYFTGPTANASGSYLYVISGMHLLHLVAGVIALGITWFKSKKGKYSASYHIGIDLCAIYWHFLGILWIYLLLFLQLIR